MDWAEELHQLASWPGGPTTPLSRVVFDPALPPADITVDATVWRNLLLQQPNADQLLHEHLFRQLPPEKIFGRAYYHLLTGLARRLCYADRSRPTAFVNDEAYDILTNPENIREPRGLPAPRPPTQGPDRRRHPRRRGRQGSEVLTGLIPTRVLMRHRDDNLAASTVCNGPAGIDPKDPDFAAYLERIHEDTSPVMGDEVPPERRGEASCATPSATSAGRRSCRPAIRPAARRCSRHRRRARHVAREPDTAGGAAEDPDPPDERPGARRPARLGSAALLPSTRPAWSSRWPSWALSRSLWRASRGRPTRPPS